jgi:hypothetical protein
MPTYRICARTNPGVPADATGDLGPLLWTQENGVALNDYSPPTADRQYLEIDFVVDADDEAEATQRVYARLADLCTTGTWLVQAGLTVDFDSDDGNTDFTEVPQVFSIVGTGRLDVPVESVAVAATGR